MEYLEGRTLLATINASAVVSSTPAGSDFNYTIKLSNVSSSNSGIGTFWYAWVPGEDFLATSPISVRPPAGWTDNITNAGAGDGFAIQFLANDPTADVQPGSSLSFSFTSADSPASVNGNSVFHPGTPVDTSFVYPQAPFSDAGHQFVVTPAPTPTPTPSVDFVIGSDGMVYTHALDSSGNPTGGYYQAAYGQIKGLAVARLGSDLSSEAFVIGTDNQVYATIVTGSKGGYFATAYGFVASVAAGTDANGNPLLFAIGTDNQLYEQKFNSAGVATSGSYTKAAFGDFKSAVLTHDSAGDPLLYAVGQDGQVYGLKMNPSGTPNGGLFKMASGGVNQLVVGSDAAHDPELYVVGTDNGVYALKAYGSGLPATGYFAIGGPVNSIAVGSDPSDNPLLFAVGTETGSKKRVSRGGYGTLMTGDGSSSSRTWGESWRRVAPL